MVTMYKTQQKVWDGLTDRQRDRQTDRQTDRHKTSTFLETCYANLAHLLVQIWCGLDNFHVVDSGFLGGK